MSTQLEEMGRQCSAALGWIRSYQPRPRTLPAAAGVLLAGSGDSYIAGQIVANCCDRVTSCDAVELDHTKSDTDYLVAVSISGGNMVLARSVTKCAAAGMETIAVTDHPGSAVARACQALEALDCGGLGPAPGVLTFLASLIVLDRMILPPKQRLVTPPARPGPVLDAALPAAADVIAKAMNQTDSLLIVPVPGSEQSAKYFAAKVVEVTAHSAHVVTVDSWVHVHRFAARSTDRIVVWDFTFHTTDLDHFEEKLAETRVPNVLVTVGDRTWSAGTRVQIDPAGWSPLVVATILAATVAHRMGIMGGHKPFTPAWREID